MIGRGFMRTVAGDLRRHWRHFGAASVGIILGVSALTFFLALGLQVRDLLLSQVYPAGYLEVAPKSVDLDLLALRLDLGRDTLDAAALEKLAAIPGVEAVYPKMRLTVPALASGGESLFGAAMQTEIVADGVDPALVYAEVGEFFYDVAEQEPYLLPPCRRDRDCGEDTYCDVVFGVEEGVCRQFIPVLVSPYVVELYNSAFRRAYQLPKINPNSLRGLRFEMVFGGSTFRPSARGLIRERMRFAGVSDMAIPLGVTLPLGHVQRLNAALGSPDAAGKYHSAVLQLDKGQSLPSIIEAVKTTGLEARDSGAQRAALMTAVLMLFLGLVGSILIAVAAAHIMHVFYLVLMMRRKEIGLLRAVGARRGDIRILLLTEGGVIGLCSGVVGIFLAILAGTIADYFASGRIPDFPFKPESFFAFSPWLLVSVLVIAVLACVIGAFAPALRATAGDPSDALAGR